MNKLLWSTMKIIGFLLCACVLLSACDKLTIILQASDATPPPQTPEANATPVNETAPCSISGLVFDSDSNQPLSGISVEVFRDLSAIQQRPERLKTNIAATGPDGMFSFNCSWVDKSQFPLLLAVHHADWVATQITGPVIDRSGQWDGIRIPIPMSEIEMRPLRDLLVSFTSKKDGSNWFVVGEVENRSEQSIPCVKVGFSMTTSYQDRLQGEPIRDFGLLIIELRDLHPQEKRAYEKQLPKQVGLGLYSKEECR